MSEAIRRYKQPNELSTDEIVQRQQAQNRGEAEPRFETDEYREAKAEALRAAGLEDESREYEAASGEKALEDMTVDDHLTRIRRNR